MPSGQLWVVYHTAYAEGQCEALVSRASYLQCWLRTMRWVMQPGQVLVKKQRLTVGSRNAKEKGTDKTSSPALMSSVATTPRPAPFWEFASPNLRGPV